MKKTLWLIMVLMFLQLYIFNVLANEKGFVNCNLLNVRVSPNTECEIVDQMQYGTDFDIIYTVDGWYNIRMNNGITGFVSADYVRKECEELNSYSTEIHNSAIGEEVAKKAYNYIGCGYSYGSSGPSRFDCSGFTTYLYKEYGYSLPRTSYSQAEYGQYIDKNDLLPGDILCFSNRSDKKVNHVGVYVGNNEFIHASTSVRGVVKDSLDDDYYVRNYVTARRVV